MSQYNQLLKVLKKELKDQEKLLDVLVRERNAIAKLNQEDVEALTLEKTDILVHARGLEAERTTVISELIAEHGLEDSPKFSDLVAQCKESSVKSELESLGNDIKNTATTVKDLNDHNAALLKQTLGTIVSTISIFRSAAGSELPTYGKSGSMLDADNKSTPTRRGVVRSA